MVQTTQKNIRFTPGQWKRVEKEAEKRGYFGEQARGRAHHGGPGTPRMAPH